MNRGKTALKRGVAVASVAAMAIAGAVLAAPAASADPGNTAGIRAMPLANANYVDSTGAAGAYNGAGVYGANAATGMATVLKAGGNQQAANSFQIVLPSAAAATTLKVTLPSTKITWAAPPTLTVDSTPRLLTSLNASAGYDGTNANVGQAISGGPALAANTVGQPTVETANKNVLDVPILAAVPTVAGGGYVLTFRNVLINNTLAATDFTTGSIPVVATLTGTPAGATTLGYVSELSIGSASAAASADASGNVTLPNITVNENVTGALGASVELTIAGGTVVTTTPIPTATVTGGATVTSVTPAGAGTVTVALGGTAATPGVLTVSGIKLSGVAKNADIKVSVTDPVTSGSATNTAASSFSYVPGLAALSTTITTAPPEPRIAGADRYATAADVLAAGTTTGATGPGAPWKVGQTNAVVIANGTTAKQGADALSANYLAAAEGAPILLTEANSLPTETQTALITLFKGYSAGDITVYVMGKSDSVSTAVQNQIKAIITSTAALPAANSVKIVSVAGADRYQTSAAAATTAGAGSLQLHSLTVGGAWARTAFLASGTVNADALSAGSIVAGAGIPVFLTNGTALDSKVSDAIKSLGITQVIALGGTDRVSAALLSGLSSIGVTNTSRIAGANRYATASALYTWAYGSINPTTGTNRGLGWTGNTAYLANGVAGFPDALSVGPLAGSGTDALLTTDGTALDSTTTAFLTANKAALSNGIMALGQSDRISSAVITAAQAAIS